MSTEMLWDETVQPVETDHSPKLATSWTAQNHAVPIVNPFPPANPSLEPVLYYEEFGPAAPRQDSPSIPVFEWDNTPSYYSSPAQSDVSLYSGPTASSRSSSSDFGFDVAGSSRRPSWDTSSPHSPAGALLHGHDLPDSDLPSWGDYTIPEDLCKPQGPPEPPATRSPRLRGKLATYPCHFCSANFTSKHNLNNHINSHLGLRQHSCKKCSRTFITESVKRRHEIKCSHEQTPTVYGNRDGTASSSTDMAVIPDASDVGTPKQDTAETGTGAVRSPSLTHRSSDLYAETSRTP
ncbi:hypothetical protein B0H10DRAFT_765160 [Mycena sp. CBHHK59/15]|nr:hypothetical protein B0H10DRAFT_765160 [Mycena sp. CBHHK59/15]